jgi:hypothetical protein
MIPAQVSQLLECRSLQPDGKRHRASLDEIAQTLERFDSGFLNDVRSVKSSCQTRFDPMCN